MSENDEKKFTQEDVNKIVGERLKNHVPKADFEALQAEVEALKGYKTKVEELESAGQTEAEKWKRKAEAETKRADAAETRINNHLQRKELLGGAKTLIEKRQLSRPDKALANLALMVKPGDTLDTVEKVYLPQLADSFPPSNVGSGGRDFTGSKAPEPNNKAMNDFIFKSARG